MPVPDARDVQAGHQANSAAAYWAAIGSDAGKDRDDDRLRAKVRAALETRQRASTGQDVGDEPAVPETERPAQTPALDRVQRADQTRGHQRWQAMGFVRQVVHKTGVRKDQLLSYSEKSEGQAVSELQQLDADRAELAQQLPQAEKAEAAAFGQAKPVAVAELAQRQERAGLARDVLAHRRQQQVGRDWKQERQQRSRGLGR